MQQPTVATFEVMTLLAVLGIGYSYAKQIDVDPIASAAVAIVAFYNNTICNTIYTRRNRISLHGNRYTTRLDGF
ncbi:hypothetical protein KK425_03655 [Clostridioides difficile]|nr:hypothetical protein [Clostridioides difficile]